MISSWPGVPCPGYEVVHRGTGGPDRGGRSHSVTCCSSAHPAQVLPWPCACVPAPLAQATLSRVSLVLPGGPGPVLSAVMIHMIRESVHFLN